MITLGLALLPVALLGLWAAHDEDTRMLRRFERLALPLAAGTLACAMAMLSPGGGRAVLRAWVDANCRELVQLASMTWFEALAPGTGCRKYYGDAYGFVNGTLRPSATAGVGDIVACFADSDRVYAWELVAEADVANASASGGSQTCGQAAVYGCLNL